MAWGIRLSVYLFLVYQFTVSALPASRNFTTVKLIPPRTQAQDAAQGQAAQRTDIGVKADQKSAFLGNKADAFRLHRPGFEHVPGSVSLESGNRPGLYLRYKNYRFHLEKMKPSGVFEKDATFIERKTQTRGAAAYELFNHPGWFMCHDTNSPFGLVAQKTEIKSHEFLTGCLYMAVAQRPTKQDIQERLKLDTVLKNENSDVTKGFVRNFSGIITNDVSAANLPKVEQNGKAMENSLNSQKNQTLQSKTHDQKDVEKSMNTTSQMQKTQATQSSNATVSGASSLSKMTDDKSLNKSVKVAADKASGFNVTKQLDDTKNAHVANVTKVAQQFHDTGNALVTNVTKHFHDMENTQVANGTQNAQKPKINLQNNLNILAVHEGKQLLHNDKKKAQDLAGNSLGNQSNSASGGAKGKNPSFSQQQTRLHSKVANNSFAVESFEKNLHGTFVSAKESAQPGLHLAQSQKVLNVSLQKNNNAIGKGFSQMKASSVKGPALQQDKNGIGFGVSAPGKNIKDKAAKGFTMHLNFPNGNPHQMNQSNQAASFTFQQNATLPAGHGPHSVQNNILQITAKTLGFLHSALQHHQQDGAPQFTKDRPVPPFQQQQRQQHRFQRPMSYFGQQRRPQQLFRGPGNKFAPAPFGSRGPLPNAFAASIGARRPQAPYAFKQFKGVGAQPQTSKAFGYKNPWNTWKGMVSVGKQSLMGNSAKPVHDQENSTKPQENNKTSVEKDKCISLKFLNKIRKPIKLVSSMKPEGYLITAETFKLRTIFKHPRKHHHVIFYARDANDRDNEVMLNNNNAIAVTPGGCDLPFRSVLLSHHGQIANKEIERLREEDEYNASIDAARKSVNGGEKENFNQWTSFSSCSASCGRSLQTRSRSCKAGKVCTGKAVEIRTCIQTPCPVTTCVKTYSGKCCALPFVYRGAVVNRCLVDPQTRRSWCATTPNYDKEKRWGFCQPAGPHTEKVAAVIRSFLPGPPGQFQSRSAPCPKECGKVCMAWCPRSCCAANSIS